MTCRHVPLRPSNMAFEAPRGYERQWVRATGEASKPIVFTLRYRSRSETDRTLSPRHAKLTSSKKHCSRWGLLMKTNQSPARARKEIEQ